MKLQERFHGQFQAHLGPLFFLGTTAQEHVADAVVITGVADDPNALVVLRGRGQVRGAADIDAIHRFIHGNVVLCDRADEVVKVYGNHVHAIPMALLQDSFVFGIRSGDDTGEELAVDRFHPAVEDFAFARVERNFLKRDTCLFQLTAGATRRQRRVAGFDEHLGEVLDAVLVRHGKQRAQIHDIPLV